MSDADFAQVTRNAPLVSVDIILRDRENKVLVMLRNDEPARSTYFVPGGRIAKNEPIAAAFERVILRETGKPLKYADARLRGVYQHFYAANRFDNPEFGTHYVVLAHDVALGGEGAIALDETHSSYRWMSEAELLASPDVHEYVKDYFRAQGRQHHAPL
jgi:colanic acid biosynthesis protein WcaH